MNSVVTNEITVGNIVSESEEAKTAAKLDDNKRSCKTNRVIRNFTYELHDVKDVFTSKISFFLKELNKQLNALVNSNIYTENKENLDKVLKSKGEFRKELLRLLKTECTDFYQKYYFEAKIFGNKAKYFRTVIEEYRRILLSRLQRQTVINMIVENPTITYQEVFNKLCELNEQQSDSDYKFNWISKVEFNNIIKQLSNLDKSTSEAASYATAAEQAGEATIDIYAIDYSSEDGQISEFNFTDNDEYYLIEFKLKYSDYTTQSDSLLTYQCQVPKKQIKGLTTGYTKLKKFTRPRIFLVKDSGADNVAKLYISFNYELSPCSERQGEGEATACATAQAAAPDGTWQFKTMGIDIGVAKSATAAIVTTNMHWVASDGEVGEQQQLACFSSLASPPAGESSAVANSEQQSSHANIKLVPAIDITQPVAISNELTISDKTKTVSEHIEILKNEQNHIYKKEQAIYDLLKLKQFDDSYTNTDELVKHVAKLVNDVTFLASPSSSADLLLRLYYKYQRLNKHRLHLRSKVSNLKKELSFLTARDMISHAIDNEVDLITMEKLSWIRDEHHTTWDYSQIQQRIIHEANIYGIKVQKVACAYSSKHNPLTLEKEEVDENRKLVKCLFDRDYAAAIILARRGVKLGKRKQKLHPVSQLRQVSSSPVSHINDSFQAVSYSIKPSLKYRQLKLCEQKSIISGRSARTGSYDPNFAYYSIL